MPKSTLDVPVSALPDIRLEVVPSKPGEIATFRIAPGEWPRVRAAVFAWLRERGAEVVHVRLA